MSIPSLSRFPAFLFVIFSIFLMVGFLAYPPSPTIQASELQNHFVYLPLIANQSDSSWQWGDAQLFSLTPTPYTSDPLLLAIDGNGNPHLWFDTLYEPRFIYHTTLTAQGWLTPTQVADTLGTSYTLFPPVRDIQGNFHLLWKNWLGSGVTDPHRLMYAHYANGMWYPEEEVYQSNYAQLGIVRVDPDGVLNVSSVNSVFYNTSRHFTRLPMGWSAPEEITVPHPVYWVWPDMLGGVQFYGEAYNTAFYHTSWLNGIQHTDELPYTDFFLAQDTQLDGQNNLHVFERAQVPIPGGTVYGVTHRCLTHDLLWTDEQVLSGETDTTSPLLKAEDGNGRIVLTWQASTGNSVHIAVFDGCTLVKTTQVVLPLDTSWDLEASALSQNPSAFCLLARKLYTSTEYLVRCATYTP